MRIFFFIVFIFLMHVSSLSASDREIEKKEAAQEAFREATALYEQGRYKAAAEKFRASYQLKPIYKILYNIGQSEAAAKRYGLSLQAFEQYLASGGDDIILERQEEVRKEITRLRGMIGFFQIVASDGVEIVVDGVSRGTYPTVKRIPVVSAVVHQISAKSANGTEHEIVTAQVAGGDTVIVNLEMSVESEDSQESLTRSSSQQEKHPQNASPPLSSEQTLPNRNDTDNGETRANENKLQQLFKNKNQRLFVSSLIVGGTGIVSLAVGSIFGGLAISKDDQVLEECPNAVCTSAQRNLVTTRDKYTNLNGAFLIAGGVLVSTGIALFVLSLRKSEKLHASGFTVVPGPGSLAVRGDF